MLTHSTTQLYALTSDQASCAIQFCPGKKTKKIFAKNNFFTLCSIINILKKRGKVQEENIFSASRQKLTAMPIYRTFFVWEFISPAESPVAGGWRMVFKGRTLDPDSNCNWVITKLSTLFAKLECEAFNSKVTFYITFILHFLHLLPPSL